MQKFSLMLIGVALVVSVSSPSALWARAERTPIGSMYLRASSGRVYVRGYRRKDGTYVRPHYRAAPGGGQKSRPRAEVKVRPYKGHPLSRNPPTTSNSVGSSSVGISAPEVPLVANDGNASECVVGRRIRHVSDGGEVVALDDGTSWQVQADDRQRTRQWWVGIDELVACRGTLVNLSKKHLVFAESVP